MLMAAQALFVLLLLPVITSLRGIDLSQLPNYLMDGATLALYVRYHMHLVVGLLYFIWEPAVSAVRLLSFCRQAGVFTD